MHGTLSPPVPSRVRGTTSPGSLIEIRVRGPRVAGWLNALRSELGAEVRLITCRPMGRRPPRLLRVFRVTAPPDRIEPIVRELERRRPKEEVGVSRLGADQLLVRQVSPLPALCASVFEVGALCSSCPMFSASDAADDGSVDWDVVVPRASDAWFLLRAFARPGEPLPRLVRSGRFRTGRGLTPRQDHALGLAFRLGYFEYPRRASLGDVARALGVSRATAMEIVRRATGRVLVERYAPRDRLAAGRTERAPAAVERFTELTA
jgi:HTH DNA binding domain